MLKKFKEIADAWITAANPTDEEKELAKKRYNICLGCEHYRATRPITHDENCKACGCPLSKKVFARKKTSCPENKWNQ
jgi:hypothetical protein